MLRSIDVAWAAGFMEGEGNFTGAKHAASLQVSAGQVQREPLERLHRLFGGSISHVPASTSHNRNKQASWTWLICGPRAVEVSLTLYVLMSLKRREQ